MRYRGRWPYSPTISLKKEDQIAESIEKKKTDAISSGDFPARWATMYSLTLDFCINEYSTFKTLYELQTCKAVGITLTKSEEDILDRLPIASAAHPAFLKIFSTAMCRRLGIGI
jgi:hypothetical protein